MAILPVTPYFSRRHNACTSQVAGGVVNFDLTEFPQTKIPMNKWEDAKQMKKQINIEGIVQMLNELIETCQSGQQSFAEAAEQLASTRIKNFCAEQSRIRAQFRADLQEEICSLHQGEKSNGFHDGKGALTLAGFNLAEDHPENGVVAVCRNLDDMAIWKYEQALNHSLPATLRSVVEYQYRSIKQAQDQLKMLDGKSDM